jgi:hypothetical protein
MKVLFTTATLLAFLSTAALAQNESTTEKPIIKEETKEKVEEKAQEIKQDVKEGAEKLKEKAEEKAPEVKQELKEAAQDVKEGVKDKVVEPVRRTNERSGLSWYEKGSIFFGGSVGFGLGSTDGFYMAIDPRLGYFFQPGFMGGLRLGFDRRLGSSFGQIR